MKFNSKVCNLQNHILNSSRGLCFRSIASTYPSMPQLQLTLAPPEILLLLCKTNFQTHHWEGLQQRAGPQNDDQHEGRRNNVCKLKKTFSFKFSKFVVRDKPVIWNPLERPPGTGRDSHSRGDTKRNSELFGIEPGHGVPDSDPLGICDSFQTVFPPRMILRKLPAR